MKKPVVLVVMDGVGETPEELGNMVKKATTPTLNELKETCPWQIIKAHGTAVGLPSDDDMGNSEVGHNALGCGQIYSQGAKLVNESIESGKIYTSDAWKNLVSDLKDNGATLHFIGLLSDGNVHSNISHLIAMLKEAKKEGVKRVRCHILLDGRDVPATSALEYVQELEDVLASLNDADFDGKIASGGGRMVVTMGAQGAVFATLDGEDGYCPAKKVDVKDTTGAGDAFFAGTVIGQTYGKTMMESCEIGTRLAASVITTGENVCPRYLPSEFGLDVSTVDDAQIALEF